MEEMDDDELELAQKYFTEEIYIHYRELVRYTYTLSGDKDMAQDAASETMLIAWQKVFYIHTRRSIRAYLRTIARNQLFLAYRKQHRLVYVADPEVFCFPLPDDVVRNLIRANDEEEIKAALMQLSEVERRVLLMHYVYDETLVEIAGKLCINYNTTVSIKRRALHKLSTSLDLSVELIACFIIISHWMPYGSSKIPEDRVEHYLCMAYLN